MTVDIEQERPDSADAISLIAELDGHLAPRYPPSSRHAFNVDRLRLETGIHQAAAIGLYERLGFRRIGPFGPCVDDPLSLFFERLEAS